MSFNISTQFLWSDANPSYKIFTKSSLQSSVAWTGFQFLLYGLGYSPCLCTIQDDWPIGGSRDPKGSASSSQTHRLSAVQQAAQELTAPRKKHNGVMIKDSDLCNESCNTRATVTQHYRRWLPFSSEAVETEGRREGSKRKGRDEEGMSRRR